MTGFGDQLGEIGNDFLEMSATLSKESIFQGRYLLGMIEKGLPEEIVKELFEIEINDMEGMIDKGLFIRLCREILGLDGVNKIEKSKLKKIYLIYISELLKEYAKYLKGEKVFENGFDEVDYITGKLTKIEEKYQEVLKLIPSGEKIVRGQAEGAILGVFSGDKK